MGIRAWMKRRHGEKAGTDEAAAALHRAREDRAESARRAPEVAAVAGRLREIRERNGFADLIAEALHGRGG